MEAGGFPTTSPCIACFERALTGLLLHIDHGHGVGFDSGDNCWGYDGACFVGLCGSSGCILCLSSSGLLSFSIALI